MNCGTFIVRNALRNKRRAALSILSVAASLFLLVTLLVTLRELTLPPEDVGAALRVVVRSKVSIANLLPARQRPIIERIPGVAAVSPFSWFGGKYKNEELMTFGQFAMDPKLLRPIFGEAKMAPEQYAAFEADQTACVVGKITADKYGLKVGDRMVLDSTIYPCSIELKIVGIYSGTIDDRNVLFHHKYLDESAGTDGLVGMWWVKVKSPKEMVRVTETINRAFANTAAEVRAETERAFQLSFVSMWGNIKILIGSISTVVVFTLLLVTVSTMSMAIRERFQELAILKALGFRRRELFAFILAESFGLAAAGGLLGIGGAVVTFNTVSISKLTQGILLTFEVTPRIIGTAALVAAVLGIVASLAPSLSVARASVVEGLRTID
jgi:putative ABC transport system permease protein